MDLLIDIIIGETAIVIGLAIVAILFMIANTFVGFYKERRRN